MASTSVETLRPSSNRTASAARTVRNAIETVLLWYAHRRQRWHLASLDDRMLRDIALTRADIEREIRKPFWRS